MEAALEPCEATLLDRLPVDRLEMREVGGRFKLCVGRLARRVNKDPEFARTVQMNEDAVMAAARATAADYVVKPECFLSRAMARQPLLACQEDDCIFLLDGLQRAALAFARGAPTVQVRLVPMASAMALRSRHSTDERSRLFEATRNHPVGADPGGTHTTAMVQMAAYTDLKREGQRLSELAAFLKDLLLFRTICAVERELAIVETVPWAERKTREDAGSKRGREDQLISRWKERYKLPVASSWKLCANEAKRVIATCSSHDGKRALDRAIRSEMAKAGPALASAMLAQEIRDRNILLKAFTRAKEHGSYVSSLVANDHDESVSDETAIQRARRKVMTLPVNGNRRMKAAASRKEAEDARTKPDKPSLSPYVIDINEQVILAKSIGINPTAFCDEATRCSRRTPTLAKSRSADGLPRHLEWSRPTCSAARWRTPRRGPARCRGT